MIHLRLVVVLLISFGAFCSGCAKKEGGGASSDQTASGDSSAEASLRCYYQAKDRGDIENLKKVVTADSFDALTDKEKRPLSAQSQELRGVVIDHASEEGDQATLCYRTWFSDATKKGGGYLAIAKLVKVEGQWKIDAKTSADLTAGIKKGKDLFGFYDGTKEWWK
jgi:hypothetical protein